MSSPSSVPARLAAVWGWLCRTGCAIGRFFRRNWIGTLVILAATAFFFSPVIARISSYSEGGDAMFNAWVLARDQHCILHEGCPHYADGNIYFPHKDTMLYSETQLSAGLVSLPFSWINSNPIFVYNVLTILCFFLTGWCMYLLVKYLSKGSELMAVCAGLVFEFAPFRMPAISHLQNLCTFYFPLMVLLIFKYLDTRRRKYLAWLLVALVLLFYASWYQMVFGLVILGVLLLGLGLFKLTNWRTVVIIAAVVAVAAFCTLPLATQYVRFSKENKATFPIGEQAYFSSSLKDYLIPYNHTVIGELYYKLRPHAKVNAYNPDSYSYHGVIMYVTGGFVFIASLVWWRRHKGRKDKSTLENTRDLKLLVILLVIGLIGFIASLGPLLKTSGSYLYYLSNGLTLAVPLPYLLVDKLLPQLMFIRALGRASVLVLFMLCVTLALLPRVMNRLAWRRRTQYIVYALVVGFIFIELFPLQRRPMLQQPFAYNLSVPAVFKYIKTHKEVDDIVVIHADGDYSGAPWPFATPEEMMWAGYANKNIFNGYSGYNPPTYASDLADFTDFHADDVPKLKRNHLRYVLVDKQLSKSNPQLADEVAQVLPHKVYEDKRYALFAIQ